MEYSLRIRWYIVFAAQFFFVCAIPTTISFDNQFLSSTYTQTLEYTMQVWSDIRELMALSHDTTYNHEYGMVQMYAIVGQLLCIDTILNQSISAIVEDIAYLAHVLEIVKQEATALPLLIPLQSDVIQHLFVTIEKKINLLLGQSDDSLISSR
jgi:hypothetical protein